MARDTDRLGNSPMAQATVKAVEAMKASPEMKPNDNLDPMRAAPNRSNRRKTATGNWRTDN